MVGLDAVFPHAACCHTEDFPDASTMEAAKAPEVGGEQVPGFASIEESGGDDGVVDDAFGRGRDRAVPEDVSQLGKCSRG